MILIFKIVRKCFLHFHKARIKWQWKITIVKNLFPNKPGMLGQFLPFLPIMPFLPL